MNKRKEMIAALTRALEDAGNPCEFSPEIYQDDNETARFPEPRVFVALKAQFDLPDDEEASSTYDSVKQAALHIIASAGLECDHICLEYTNQMWFLLADGNGDCSYAEDFYYGDLL